jgi:RNA polymerase sigma factor (sigma-70 family)
MPIASVIMERMRSPADEIRDNDVASDEALITRYAAGDVAAFDQLYSRHELPVWRFLLRQCRQRATAEELHQETWLAVAREAPRFRPEARFATWLYAIARHRLIDRLRATRPQVSLDTVIGDDGETAAHSLRDELNPTPPESAERLEQGEAILAALAHLPAEQREAFLLQAEGGLSVGEIATATGTGFETAKSRLRYARDRLKLMLQDYA